MLGAKKPFMAELVSVLDEQPFADRYLRVIRFCVFFFQAEDGIRDVAVTGVQTCALPICWRSLVFAAAAAAGLALGGPAVAQEKLTVWWAKGFYKSEDDALLQAVKKFEQKTEIGRASCRERV